MPEPVKALVAMVREFDEQLNVAEVRALQLENALPPILVTEAGMVMDVNPVPSKACIPMLVSCEPAANDTEVKSVQ